MSDTESIELVVSEIPEKERYKCEVCNLNFYKRYYSPSQNARALEGHLQRESHKHNVERRLQGLEPEKRYALTTVGKHLGELVELLGSRLEDLEEILKTQTRRLESLESGSVRSWLETVPEHGLQELPEPLSAETELRCQKAGQRASVHFQETTRLGPPHSRDWECCSDACSEDTTATDITEAEYPPLHPTPNRRDEELSYSHLQNRKVPEPPFEEESSRFGRAMMSRSKAFRPTEMETSAVYQYDGNNYTAMVQVTNMLDRLMIWMKQHYSGVKLTTNLQYIQRTQSALNVQIRQRMNQEPRDAEDTELLLDRLYSVMEHEWEA